MSKFRCGETVLIKSKGVCNGLLGTIIGKWDQDGYIDCYKVKVKNEYPYTNRTICVKEKNIEKVNCFKMRGDRKVMPGLTDYKQVAVIQQGGREYYFAIYEDGYNYQSGDRVVVTGNNCIQTIREIITPEEVVQRFKQNITAEIICPVDTLSYEIRIRKRKKVEELLKKMDQIITEMDKTERYEMYADRNPELKQLLDQYKELMK